MEEQTVDVANLNSQQKQTERIVRAHDEEVSDLKLVKFEDRGAGNYFLIFEKTPQFHTWYEVTSSTENDKTTYSLNKVPHMG